MYFTFGQLAKILKTNPEERIIRNRTELFKGYSLFMIYEAFYLKKMSLIYLRKYRIVLSIESYCYIFSIYRSCVNDWKITEF